MNRWYVILTDPKSWKYMSHARWDTRGSTSDSHRTEEGDLRLRGFIVASAGRKGEAGHTGLPLAGLSNCSELLGTGAGPGAIVKWPLCESPIREVVRGVG